MSVIVRDKTAITLHNHASEEGMFVVLHTRFDAAVGLDNPAHCFGPFWSEDAAKAFDKDAGCECFRTILDLVAPPPAV